MNEKVMKPMSVARQEFVEQLVNDVNNCGLPLLIVEPILQDMLNEVRATMKQQYEFEKAQYEQQLQKQNESATDSD